MASALPKCSIMSGCGTRIVLRGQKPLAFCDRCPCFGSLFPPLAALTFAASSIICAFGLASAAPRSPYRHLELYGIALDLPVPAAQKFYHGRHHIFRPARRTARFLPCTSSCPFQLLTITEMLFCTVFSNVFLLQYFSKKRSLYVIFIYLFVSLKRRGTCLSFKFRSKCVIFLAI